MSGHLSDIVLTVESAGPFGVWTICPDQHSNSSLTQNMGEDKSLASGRFGMLSTYVPCPIIKKFTTASELRGIQEKLETCGSAC